MKICYIISYDLEEGQSYDKIIEYIKSFGTWSHITQSTWAVFTDKKASELRNDLIEFIGNKGRVFVVRSGTEAAWKNTIGTNEWLQKYL